jgi:serine/threonine protein kinase
MPERDPFDWLGHTVDERYDVQTVAGSGGFGIVYRGHHRSLDAPVAIKCLKVPQDLAVEQRREFERRFTEEGRVLHRLSRASAAIVQALDVGAATSPSGAWTPYLVLEWLDGSPLDAIIADRARGRPVRWSVTDAVRLLTPAAEALAEAHDQRIAHRDVKPANLFLAKVGDRQLLKVLDFGIAKVLHESLSQSEALRVTGHAPRAFTPQYGAPEQFDRRKGATGPWTDVHALALVVIELVVGRPALEGDDVVQLMACALDANVRPTPRSLGVELGDELETVLGRALAVRPEDRFPDARAFWQAILRATDLGTDSSARPSGPASNAELETGEFLASLDGSDPAPERGPRRAVEVSAKSLADEVPPGASERVATTSPAIVDDRDPRHRPSAPPKTSLIARVRPLLAVAALATLTYGAFRSRRLDPAHADNAALATAAEPAETVTEPRGARESASEASTEASSSSSSAQGGPPPAIAPAIARAVASRPGATGSTPETAVTGTSTAPPPPSSATEGADELGPEACGRDCKIDGLCTPKVVAGSILCRASTDADCKRSSMCFWHGACHARKGLCAALSQADCDASEGCKQTHECSLSRGKCVQDRYDTDADCRKTPGCTMNGRCTAQNNNCFASNEADCRASAWCKTHGFCRNLGDSCVK